MRLLTDRSSGHFNDYPQTLATEICAGLRALMYCGAMICEPAVLDILPANPPFSLIANVLAPMVARGFPLFGYVHEGFFRTVDDLQSYEQVRAEFAASPPPLPYLR